MAWWWLWWACGGDPGVPEDSGSGAQDPPPPAPGDWDGVLVVMTLDTLGAWAAEQTGWCEAVTGVFEAHGLDVACVGGGVAPSSWTAPSHTRMLWPRLTTPANGGRDAPQCGDDSVLGEIADYNGATYIFGADNPVIGQAFWGSCGVAVSPFAQGADEIFAERYPVQGPWTLTPEPERAVHRAIDAAIEHAATGEPLIVFLNAYEVGGHVPPRCALAPGEPGCQRLWFYLVEHQVVDAQTDRRSAWLDRMVLSSLEAHLLADFATDPLAARPMLWGSTRDAILASRGPMALDRLDRLLSGLEDAGRLDDATFVIVGDHGESPGDLPLNGVFNPAHGGQPTEWTARVPVFIAPASASSRWQGAGWIGDDGVWWSTASLPWAMAAETGTPVPPDWPSSPRVGLAASWSCNDFRDAGVYATGIVVSGDASLRCVNATCGAFSWGDPTSLEDVPTPRTTLPPELSAWLGPPNRFERTCPAPTTPM